VRSIDRRLQILIQEAEKRDLFTNVLQPLNTKTRTHSLLSPGPEASIYFTENEVKKDPFLKSVIWYDTIGDGEETDFDFADITVIKWDISHGGLLPVSTRERPWRLDKKGILIEEYIQRWMVVDKMRHIGLNNGDSAHIYVKEKLVCP